MWFMTNDRNTLAFGMEKIVWPSLLSAHGAISSASVLPASAGARAATFLSKMREQLGARCRRRRGGG